MRSIEHTAMIFPPCKAIYCCVCVSVSGFNCHRRIEWSTFSFSFAALARWRFFLPCAICRRGEPRHDLLDILFRYPSFTFVYEVVYALVHVKFSTPWGSALPARNHTNAYECEEWQ